MELQQLNDQLKLVSASTNEDARGHIFHFADMLVQWLGIEMQPNWPVMQEPINIKQRNFLVLTPKGMQPQKYRYTERTDPVYVRLAVVKNLRKQTLNDFAERDLSFQTMAAQLPADKRELSMMLFKANAYHLHLFTTADYDRLVVVVSQGEQKRIVTFKQRLSHTQFNRLLPAWKGVALKSKLEVMDQLWASLDIREVNKEFYLRIKERFDDLVGILEAEHPKATDTQRKQFAVRLIGRYIFCWFLKEKGIIPSELLSSQAIQAHHSNYHQVYLSHLFLNTLNEEVQQRTSINTGSPLDKLFQHIPYLNGGLFEEHPEDRLFGQSALNDWLLSFVDVLEKYDFTVDESSSTYQHVAIDPEMLGRIFENLLASQNPETEKLANTRKAFGAFYTPREIVEYMVNGALRSHLEQKLLPPQPPQQLGLVKEPPMVYGSLAIPDHQSETPANTWTPAYQDNYNMRHKRVMEVLDRFFETDRADNPFSKDDTITVRKALAEVTVLDPACGSGAFPMSMLLRLMELREIVGHGHSSRYDLKDEILSRNIYGVDIMPMAVEIARLRAWLSLVLESDFKPKDKLHNFGIKALPNLDFKFVCANSLVDSGYDGFMKLNDPTKATNAKLFKLQECIQQLERLRNSYYDPKGDKHRKQELKAEFYATKNRIKSDFMDLEKSYSLAGFLSNVDQWDPFDDSRPSPFFSSGWMFGIRDGFDVVIGNPPYIPIESISDLEKAYFKKKFGHLLRRKYDTSVLFVIDGLGKLSENGVVVFIAPTTWQTGENYSEFRKFLITDNGIRSVLNLPFDMFESAYVDTGIFLFNSFHNSKYELYVFNKKHKDLNLKSIPFEQISLSEIYAPNFKLVINSEIQIILNRLKEPHFVELGRITKSTQGLSGSRFTEVAKTAKSNLVFPFLEKGSVSNYQLSIENTYHTDLSDKKSLIEYYEAEPKLLIRRIISRQDRLVIAYTEDKMVFKKDINPFIVTDHRYQTKFILSVLASTLLSNIYIKSSSIATKDDFRQTTLSELRKLPIKAVSKVEQQPFVNYVDEILLRKHKGQDTLAIEMRLDIMVYKLYNLTHSEVLTIDPNFGMSVEEYERFNIE